MKLCTLILIALPAVAIAQKTTVSGKITDKDTGENLIGASIINKTSGHGAATNTYGFFSLTIPADSIELHISYVGYRTSVIRLNLPGDTVLNLSLSPADMLQEIVISADADEATHRSTRMGTVDVPVDQIKALPALMGEVDVFKVLQLLPGVQSGAEGSSGLYVRGGGPDQNLILLDGVPVYNASHLFGFFSVFNADAINHVELVKGGFPARYGGRLSSVIDITMKEGNNKEVKGEGAIGLIASKFTIEGPIKKNKSSFILSARRTYVDLITRPILKKATKGEETAGYFFYDLNAKVNFHLNENNRIFFSTYLGDDKAFARSLYNYKNEQEQWTGLDEFGLKWGNLTSAVRWNHVLSSKLFSNVTAIYSKYRFAVGADSKEVYTNSDTTATTFYHTNYYSGIRDYGLKIDFDFVPNPAHYIRFGGQYVDHLFSPGVLAYRSERVPNTTLGAATLKSREILLYAEDDLLVNPNLKVNAGVHVSGFITEATTYSSVQPRISARYLLNEKVSLKGSYAKMTQFIHLLTNAGIGLPTDLWVPSTPEIKPEESWIAAAGGAWKINNDYDFSIEGYYKEMTQILEYKEGANYLSIEQDWQTKVETGKGESYGSEFFLQKKTSKISGWLGYTLSWTNRTFRNINHGKEFPYRYDRRHDVELAVAYKWKATKELSLTWVFGTGSAVSLPQSAYLESDNYPYGTFVKYYGGRNAYRMRSYHRLDLGYTTTRKTRWGERSWNISVYNAYNRRNPFFIEVGRDDEGTKKFVQYSLFPIIPSIAFRFKF